MDIFIFLYKFLKTMFKKAGGICFAHDYDVCRVLSLWEQHTLPSGIIKLSFSVLIFKFICIVLNYFVALFRASAVEMKVFVVTHWVENFVDQ